MRAANLKAGHRSGDVPRPRKVLTPVPDSSAVAELYTLKGDVWQQAKDGKLTPNEQRLRRRLHAATELTPVKVQDRVPQWLAASTLRLPRHAEAVDASTLVVRAFDDLADDPAKATGAATIPLAKIRTFAAVDAGWRAWHDLGDEFHDRGQVDVWLRLSYDPSIVPEEVLEDEVEAPEALSEPANELKVVVVGARVRTQHTRRNKHLLHKDSIEVARDLGMAVADDDKAEEQTLSSFERLAKQHHDSEEASHASSMHQNLLKLGGLEATLKFMGRDRHTRLAPWDDSDKALRLTTGKCPAYWREAFNFVAKDDRDGVDVILTEVDDHGKKFYVGQCHIKMADLTHRRPVRKFYPIERGHKGGADADVQSAAEIELCVRLSHSLHLATFLLPDPVLAIATQCTAEDAPPVPPRRRDASGGADFDMARAVSVDPGDDVDMDADLDPDAVPRWFYAEGEAEGDAPEAVGPHNLHDLKEFWKHRTITNDTRVSSACATSRRPSGRSSRRTPTWPGRTSRRPPWPWAAWPGRRRATNVVCDSECGMGRGDGARLVWCVTLSGPPRRRRTAPRPRRRRARRGAGGGEGERSRRKAGALPALPCRASTRSRAATDSACPRSCRRSRRRLPRSGRRRRGGRARRTRRRASGGAPRRTRPWTRARSRFRRRRPTPPTCRCARTPGCGSSSKRIRGAGRRTRSRFIRSSP